jgi:hypothetical protein
MGRYAKSTILAMSHFVRNICRGRLEDSPRPKREALLDIDCLVYSSHKTATQTVAHTLRLNNYKCIHCHSLGGETTRLERGTFAQYLEEYHLCNRRRLNIVTIFREPIERYVSSFFSYYGWGVVRKKSVRDATDTIIHKLTVQELQERFVNDVDSRAWHGLHESIDEICSELNIGITDLNYDVERRYGLVEMDDCRLFIFRFDVLTDGNVKYLLSQVTGRASAEITQKDTNLGSDTWYRDKYAEFKASLKMPQSMIRKIYEARRDMISLLYPGEYDRLLSEALERYG